MAPAAHGAPAAVAVQFEQPPLGEGESGAAAAAAAWGAARAAGRPGMNPAAAPQPLAAGDVAVYALDQLRPGHPLLDQGFGLVELQGPAAAAQGARAAAAEAAMAVAAQPQPQPQPQPQLQQLRQDTGQAAALQGQPLDVKALFALAVEAFQASLQQ